MKIGAILPLGEDAARRYQAGYAELRGLALQAEEAGLDSVWVYDHLLYRWPDMPGYTQGIWECWTILSALCEATRRVELGMLVMCVPWRNPALLAKMAVTADEVSGGRVILGLGAGWHQPEFEAFGVPFDHLASRFEEGLKIIGPLLRDGVVDFTGRFYSAPNGALVPRGPRPGKPEILVASRGERMLRLTAEHADQWNTAWLGNPTIYRERWANMQAACHAVGRDPATLTITVGVTVVFDQLIDVPERLNDPAKALIGTPEQIAEGFRAWEAEGVHHLICGVEPNNSAGWAELAKAVAAYRG